jgi:hypothetical protein
MQARLGLRVKISREEGGRIRRAGQGVLKPGIPGATEAVPDDLGPVAFMIVAPGPNTYGFLLDPRVLTAVQEQPDRRLLRVEILGGSAFVIETLSTARNPLWPSQLDAAQAAERLSELVELAERMVDAVNRSDVEAFGSVLAPDAVLDRSRLGLEVVQGRDACRNC